MADFLVLNFYMVFKVGVNTQYILIIFLKNFQHKNYNFFVLDITQTGFNFIDFKLNIYFIN